MLEQASDLLLMERIQSGDGRAFRVLVARHLSRAHAVAWRMLVSTPDTEEVVQDAFTKLWTHAYKYDASRAAVSTWLMRIVINTATDCLRRRPPLSEDIAIYAESLEDMTQRPDSHCNNVQRGQHIQAAIHSLPERQRIAVILCYLEDYTQAEAATILKIHIKALEGLLSRARKQLAVLLEPLHDSLGE